MPGRGTRAAKGSARPFPKVSVVDGAAFELIAELAAFTSGPARASLESGKGWIRDVRRLAGPRLIERVERYSIGIYGELATIALELPRPRDVDRLLAAMTAIDADVLRIRLLGGDSQLNRSMVSNGAIERAVAGDAAARAELRSALGVDRRSRDAVTRLLDGPARTVKMELIAIVRDWANSVFPAFAAGAHAAISRDAKAKREMLATEPPESAVTAATSGVAFQPSPWVRAIALIPTVALRPFVLPTELRDTAVFMCSVADESLDVDPAAPPRRLVKAAAALGDELRLRVLHVLGEGDFTASEIADRLQVDRTSLHHHLGILRSAGLLAIRDEGERGWRYGLRRDAMGGLDRELATYLGVDRDR
jgi:DNA-binding transcriptional ArsR family regulator